jgi:chemotaxis protein MotA
MDEKKAAPAEKKPAQAGKKSAPAMAVRPDLATLLGLGLALSGIVGGLLLEGGALHDITQYTAAIIVLGGTIGAVMVSTPMHILSAAIKRLGSVMVERSRPVEAIIEQLINHATKARKNGIVSLEQEAESEQDPFMRKALNLAVDGTDLQEIRKMMELEIALEEHQADAEAKVYEAAGGYSPTIGIIGAVLGLIQVMKNLSDIDKVGHGIAVSFVATVYGVAIANIFFLPVAAKIKARAHGATQIKELTLEGIIAIVEGLNPKLIRAKLEAYAMAGSGAKPAAKAAKAGDQGTTKAKPGERTKGRARPETAVPAKEAAS